jgi:predicted TIM-barrel fold metal-dependent hydrolase
MASGMQQKLISADSHVHFTDEWVKARLPQRLQERWDDAVRRNAEYEASVLREGQPPLAIEDFVDLEAAKDPGHFEPHAKLAAMDRDGVEAEVIFPEVGGAKLCTPELVGEDWRAMLAGYNDAMADFAAIAPARLLTAYQIPLYDIDFAVGEVERLAKRGARCAQLPVYPREFNLPDVQDSRYDPLWHVLSESGIAVLNHLEVTKQLWGTFRRDPTPQKGIFTALPASAMAEAMAFWILTGTLERFPKLKVIYVEPALGWLPWFFELLDSRMNQHYEFPGVKKLPSEYFRTQMGATFMYEPTGLAACYRAFGPDCLYWSTDFPHPATCWPHSQEQVTRQFAEAGIPKADMRKIVYDNALNTFGLKN